jgi:hypothetical protein
MKSKLMTVGFILLGGLPLSLCARDFSEKEKAHAFSFGNGLYVPHFGDERAVHPLMEHLSAPVSVAGSPRANVWQFGLASTRNETTEAENPLTARDKPVGLTLKLQF